MKRIKSLTKLLLIMIVLSSCRTSIDKEYPVNNSEEDIKENTNIEKQRMEINLLMAPVLSQDLFF